MIVGFYNTLIPKYDQSCITINNLTYSYMDKHLGSKKG